MFPSSLRSTSSPSLPKRADSLNATQQKLGSNPILMKIEEELHDARRVKTHGQEEDLRLALDMVINRVVELTSVLTEAYKTQADLEVQLNVAKSNLALVISNNEMLEDALRRDSSGGSKDVGWQRRSGNPSGERQSLEEWQHAVEFSAGNESHPASATNSPQIPHQGTPSTSSANQQENGRFFKFRFASNATASRSSTRPSTPSGASTVSPQIPQQVQSPTIPSIPSHITKELEDLGSELQKERSARKSAEQEKANLEAELESLSQALFEEANKMVATERIKRAETEEELHELRMEKDALKRALRLIEGENHSLREGNVLAQSSLPDLHAHTPPIRLSRSRSSSEVAIKSRPSSLILESAVPLPPSPAPDTAYSQNPSASPPSPPAISQSLSSADSQITPKSLRSQPLPYSPSLPSFPSDIDQASPWADVPSSSTSASTSPSAQIESGSLYAAAALAMR